MKVRSKIELKYSAGRDGVKQAIIEVDLRISNRDQERKIYSFSEVDYAITDGVLDPMYPGGGRQMITSRQYEKTYAEYDAELAELALSDTSGLTGSELEDRLIHNKLYTEVTAGKYYGSASTNWEVV